MRLTACYKCLWRCPLTLNAKLTFREIKKDGRWNVSRIRWFIVFVHPVDEPTEVFGERMRCLEGDWANDPSVAFNPTNRDAWNERPVASWHLCTTGNWRNFCQSQESPSRKTFSFFSFFFLRVILAWHSRLAILDFRDEFWLVPVAF